MARFPTHFDVVELDLTFDSSTFTHLFGEEEQLTITCMRLTDTSQWTQGYVFGRLCADPLDYRNLPSTLPDHPWDELKNAVWPDDEESVEEERVGAGGNVEAEPAGNVNADVSSEDHAASGMEEDADALSTHADMQESSKTEL